MESLRVLQQRIFLQLFAPRRATLPRQILRQLPPSTPRSQVCRFSSRHSTPFNPASRYRPRSAHPSPSFRPRQQQQRWQQQRWQSTSNTTSDGAADLSLSGRLRKLSREYGWSALGVYLLLSALDFPFCFLAVRTLGTDRIGRWEHQIFSWIKTVIPQSVLDIRWPWGQKEVEMQIEGPDHVDGRIDDAVDMSGKIAMEKEGSGRRLLEEHGPDYRNEPSHDDEVMDHGVEEAEKANRGENASIWTQLALAYAIHKSFIFLRVPLTAAVTPKVVKTLRGWGWNIGKRPQTGRLAKKAKPAKAEGTGINTQGSGVKPE